MYADSGSDLSPALVFGRHVWAVALDYRSRMREALHAGGHPDLGPPHAAIISNLPISGAGVGELAERADLSIQRAGQLVQQLVNLGYLERRIDESDARARRIEFSERGLDLLRAVECVGAEIWREYEERIGSERLGSLAAGVDGLHFALAGEDDTLKLGRDDEASGRSRVRHEANGSNDGAGPWIRV